MERRGKLEELDRSFEPTFWQAQSPQVRLLAAWELVTHAAKVEGIPVRQLQLHRSIENF